MGLSAMGTLGSFSTVRLDKSKEKQPETPIEVTWNEPPVVKKDK
jgi:hypothetical protein